MISLYLIKDEWDIPLSNQGWMRYPFVESEMPLFKWMVNFNYVYSPFMEQIFKVTFKILLIFQGIQANGQAVVLTSHRYKHNWLIFWSINAIVFMKT